jgi:hypothetical protein
MRRFSSLLLTLLVGAMVPVVAGSDSAPSETEHNRRLLDQYRADPDHYDRLLRDLRAFQTLPADKQQRMRQFDRELHDGESAEQGRLWETLVRYTDWVNRLPEADQKRIEQAADWSERLEIVKKLRFQDWMQRLPKKDRDELAALPEADGAARLAAIRKEERERRKKWQDWADSLKARPAFLPEVPNSVLRDFANSELTREDRARLHLGGADLAEKREILKQEYFKRHPEALQKYRRK